MLAVGRFVKYTGYGNAAGLLAQRGLMCGGHGAVYSSESEDSETEEYSQLKDKYVIHAYITFDAVDIWISLLSVLLLFCPYVCVKERLWLSV